MPTENYQFPEYAGDESVDVLEVYNKAVTSIDALIKAVTDTANANATDIDELQEAGDTTKQSLADLIGKTNENSNAIADLQGVDTQTARTIEELQKSVQSTTQAVTDMQAAVKTNSDDIASLKTSQGTITPSPTDAALTVEGLSNAKTMSNGIMYAGTDTNTEVN